MQAAGGVVGAGAELAAGVQLGEDDLDPGEAGPRFDVDGDAAGLVGHRDAAVSPQGDRDLPPVPAERLVDGVVDDLPEAVHEPAGVGGADVHRRPLADRLEALEDQQVPGFVLAVLGRRGGGRHVREGTPDDALDPVRRLTAPRVSPSTPGLPGPQGRERRSLHKRHGSEMGKGNNQSLVRC